MISTSGALWSGPPSTYLDIVTVSLFTCKSFKTSAGGVIGMVLANV